VSQYFSPIKNELTDRLKNNNFFSAGLNNNKRYRHLCPPGTDPSLPKNKKKEKKRKKKKNKQTPIV
jgi:hypothetical protein